MDNVTKTTETFRVEDLINLLLEKEKSLRYREETPAMTVSQSELCLAIEIIQLIERSRNQKKIPVDIEIIDCNCLTIECVGYIWAGGIIYQNAAAALDSLIPKLVASKKVNLLEKTEKLVKLEFVF